jgi:hypothetical protein
MPPPAGISDYRLPVSEPAGREVCRKRHRRSRLTGMTEATALDMATSGSKIQRFWAYRDEAGQSDDLCATHSGKPVMKFLHPPVVILPWKSFTDEYHSLENIFLQQNSFAQR